MTSILELHRVLYRSLSKMGSPMLGDDATRRHPTLYELLSPLYNSDDFDDDRDSYTAKAIERLRQVNRDHLNEQERDAIRFELPKLENFKSAPVQTEAFERLMGLLPPKRAYAYTLPITRMLEHLTITKTIDKLRDTALGNMLLGKGRAIKYKPKKIIGAIRASPFAHMIYKLGPEVAGNAMTGEEAEELLFAYLVQDTTKTLLANQKDSILRAEELYEESAGLPIFLTVSLNSQLKERIAYFER